MTAGLLGAIAIAYLVILAALARGSETAHSRLSVIACHPLTYALALTVYFTAWAYFGEGAALYQGGLGYLAHVLGWSFAFLFGWPWLMKAARLVRTHHVTTLPGFLTVRYGPLPLLGGLVAVVLVMALLPYIALQLEAVAMAVHQTAGGSAIEADQGAVLAVAVFAGVFAILFGARGPDPATGHRGLVLAMAVNAVVKLGALLAVTIFAYLTFPQLASGLADPAVWPEVSLGTRPANTYMGWIGGLLLAMAAVVLLPHMFQIGMVESRSDEEIRLAGWAFPLYGWLFELAVLPLTVAGVLIGLRGAELERTVLALPIAAGHAPMTLLAYVGGIAAASGMTILALLALTHLVLSDLLLPLLHRHLERLGPALVPIRWALLLTLALAAYGLWRVIDTTYLFQTGLVSFIAVAQLAPAFFLGLVWPGLPRRAVAWGLGLAIAVWGYTGLLPLFADASPLVAAWVSEGPAGLALLRPQALLGVEGLDPSLHSLFWCLSVNLGALLVVSMRHPLSAAEAQRARDLLAGQPTWQAPGRLLGPARYEEMTELLASFLGPDRAASEMAAIRAGLDGSGMPPEHRLLCARSAVERLLNGPLGPSAAGRVVAERFPVSPVALAEVMEAYQAREELLKRQLETTFDHLADAILVADPDGKLVLVNRAMVALAQGPGKDFFVGMPIAELVRLVGLMTLDGEPVSAADTASTRALAGERFGYLARWRGLGGRGRVLDISSVPIRDAQGRVVQAVTVIRDITEAYELRTALEERVEERTAELKAERDRLSQTIEELHRAETVKGAFVNAISHDLRIPVTGLVGYAEFLEDEIGGPLTPEQREFVTGIQEAARRMTGLLDDLLDFARMEAHQMKIEARPIRYAEALDEALRTFRPPAQKKGLTLGTELPPDLPAVQADPVRLVQVLSNFLSNAIKFTPEGGQVVVRVRCDGRECRTEVQDTGVGIGPEDVPHMFERFYQAEAGRRAGGTGLGLSIVKTIVEGHGGRVGVESKKGEGSTFWFTLPLAEPGP